MCSTWNKIKIGSPLGYLLVFNSKFTAAIKRGQSQARLSYAEREQTREDL